MDTAGAIALLEGEPAYRGQLVHVEQVPSRAGRHRAPGHPLPSPLHSFLDQRSIDLYTHQADAYDAWASGADVVIAAGTAGGKTLAFNLAVADALLGDSEATALYLYPTKALAQDQLGELLSLDATLHLSARPAIYDGDTPAGRRRQIRTRSRIIVSNPYGLHEYLPQHAGWQSFMSKLAVVVRRLRHPPAAPAHRRARCVTSLCPRVGDHRQPRSTCLRPRRATRAGRRR